MKIHGTAKGGALSKKDFGVAFGGATGPTGGSCEQTVVSGQAIFGVAQYGSRIGIKIDDEFTCAGGAIESVVFNFKKVGGPWIGSVYARVYDKNNVEKCTLGSYGINTEISETLTNYTFDEPDEIYTLQGGDFIVLEWGNGTGSAYLEVSVSVGTAVNNVSFALYAPVVSPEWSTDADDSCYYQIES